LYFLPLPQGQRWFSARADVLPAILRGIPPHDLRRAATPLQQVRHHPHGQIDVPEKPLVPGAQVVQPRLPIRSRDESIARAFAIACEQYVALAAKFRQEVVLVPAEPALQVAGYQLEQGLVLDVPSR